jgi:hypothetical protein
LAETASALLKRHASLKQQASNYWTVCQDIAEQVVPHKSAITIEREPGSERTEKVFDSTAIHACLNLASMIHGTMTPATQPWISFALRDEELDAKQEVREWLEDCSKRIHKALRQSNFSSSVHELDWDLCAFGTGCMLIEEKEPDKTGAFAGFRFTTVSVGKFTMAENKDGVADTLFREVPMTRRAVMEQFGQGGKVPDMFKEKAKQAPDDIVVILHAVYPRRDRAYTVDGPKKGAKNMPWASCYVLQEPKVILDEGGFEEFPYVVPRWSKVTGEVYGFGPSHTALPDVRTLNAFVQFMLQAIPLAMQPPTMERSDSVVGDPDLTPGGRNFVETAGPISDSFTFMDTKYRPDISAEFRVSFSDAIKRFYHANELQLREGPQMTATEVQVRYELMQRLLGPTTGRLETEKLNPMAWRMFAVMARRGAFKQLPGVLTEAVGSDSAAADLDLQYEGPLARAQRTVELTAQDRFIQFLMALTEGLAPVNPSMASKLWFVPKLEMFLRQRADITGLPADSMHSEDEYQALVDEQKQAEAQRNQLEQAKVASEVGRNMQGFVQPPGGAGKGKAA